MNCAGRSGIAFTKGIAGRFLVVVCVLMLGLNGLPACNTPTSSPPVKTKLVVFEADSLMVPLAQVEKEFESANPDIDVLMEAHGSIQVIRQVTELEQDVDVVAVADFSLIPMLMYATTMPDGRPYADCTLNRPPTPWCWPTPKTANTLTKSMPATGMR